MYVPLASRVETRMSVGDLVDRRNFGAQFSFLSGPSEHRGAVGICTNQILSSALTLFQPGADYAHHLGMSQPIFKSFRRAWTFVRRR